MKGIIVFLTLVYILAFLIASIMLIYEHEQVHVSIYETYGVDSNVDYFRNDLTARTIPIYPSNGSCNENCRILNEINEIVGYHANSFLLVIGMGFMTIIILLTIIAYSIYYLVEVKNRNEEEELWQKYHKTES